MSIREDCGAGVDYRGTIRNEIGVGKVNSPIDGLLRQLMRDDDARLDLSPDYQRAHVWTDAQAEAFVGAVAESTPTPAIFIRRGAYPAPDQVVDGKQRLTALVRFVSGEIGAALSDGRRVMWADFDIVDRRFFLHNTVQVVHLAETTTEADVLRIYLRLNKGGTPHTAEELQRVEELLAAAERRERAA